MNDGAEQNERVARLAGGVLILWPRRVTAAGHRVFLVLAHIRRSVIAQADRGRQAEDCAARQNGGK